MSDEITLVVVGCGKAKKDGHEQAQNLYTSAFFSVKKDYALSIGDSWQILSAKYGMIRPGELVQTYDQSIDDLDDRELERLASAVSHSIREWIGSMQDFSFNPESRYLGGNESIEVQLLLGRRYLEPLDERGEFDIDDERVTVTTPLQDAECSGMGEQMSWMKEQIDTRTHTGVIAE